MRQDKIDWNYNIILCPRDRDVMLAFEGLFWPIIGRRGLMNIQNTANIRTPLECWTIGMEQQKMFERNYLFTYKMYSQKDAHNDHKGVILAKPYAWAHLPIMPPMECKHEPWLLESNVNCEKCGTRTGMPLEKCPYCEIFRINDIDVNENRHHCVESTCHVNQYESELLDGIIDGADWEWKNSKDKLLNVPVHFIPEHLRDRSQLAMTLKKKDKNYSTYAINIVTMYINGMSCEGYSITRF